MSQPQQVEDHKGQAEKEGQKQEDMEMFASRIVDTLSKDRGIDYERQVAVRRLVTRRMELLQHVPVEEYKTWQRGME